MTIDSLNFPVLLKGGLQQVLGSETADLDGSKKGLCLLIDCGDCRLFNAPRRPAGEASIRVGNVTNPECENVAIVMSMIKFRKERCKGCGLCVMACPKQLLIVSSKINRSGYPVARIEDMAECTGCALCAEMCPDVVISVFK